MIWDRVLRMLRLRSLPTPDLTPDPELKKAVKRVETLHRQADRVLDEYAEAENQRLANGHR